MTTLSEYTTAIEDALSTELCRYVHPAELYAPVTYLFNGGGKRIRPLLTLLAAHTVGEATLNAMPAALAMELLHNFTLVHDDIMDRSPLRRGRPTVHMKYDYNSAILSGDVILGMGMKLLAACTATAEAPSNVFSAYAQGFIDVCEGQSLDMTMVNRDDTTTDEYFRMIELKTARLLETCVTIGSMIGGAGNAHIDSLRLYARKLGLAFQLQDDILDVEGSDAFGKTPGGDLVEGKRTWLVLRARDLVQHNHPQFRALISEFFANNGISPSHVPEMRTCLHELGVVNEATAIVQRLTDEAFGHLNTLPETIARQLLQELSHMLMRRSS